MKKIKLNLEQIQKDYSKDMEKYFKQFIDNLGWEGDIKKAHKFLEAINYIIANCPMLKKDFEKQWYKEFIKHKAGVVNFLRRQSQNRPAKRFPRKRPL